MAEINSSQKKIDYEKWLESEKKHKDMCGSYDFCKYCDKSLENPMCYVLLTQFLRIKTRHLMLKRINKHS